MSIGPPTTITIDQSDIAQPEGPYTPGNTQNAGWDHVLRNELNPTDKIVNDTTATDRPLLSELYPETQKRYMPELYKHMRSNLTYEELKKYQNLDAKTLISTLEQDGKIQIHGEGGNLLRDSLVRLTNGSKIFRQSLMIGLAADKKYNLYADTFDKLDQELIADGSSLAEQGHGVGADPWLAFAPLDEFVGEDKSPNLSIKKSYNKVDGVFNIASIIKRTDFTQ